MMRETQRRRLLYQAQQNVTAKIKSRVALLLAQRFKALKRELRRANLRKRLKKFDGILQKDDGGWVDWTDEFSSELNDLLMEAVDEFGGVESDYFTSHGEMPLNLDPQKVVLDYHDRVGRLITDIATRTLKDTQDAVTAWYNSPEGLPALIDDLAPMFGDDRAELIARTESGFVRSQVALEAMQTYGIDEWIWDSAMEARTCEFCRSMHGTVHSLDDEMPPDASHPDCLCGIVYARNGEELIYSSDAEKMAKGDVVGHEFHGNQWTGGGGLSAHSDYIKSLSDEQRYAMRRYTGGDFFGMNAYLRSGKRVSPNIVERTHVLTDVIQNAPPLEEQTMLYRMTSGDPSKYGMEPGVVFTDKGFTSTSLKTNYGAGPNGTQLVIEAPAGTHGLSVGAAGGHASESEYILPPGSNFLVTSVVQVDDNHWTVNARLQP